MNYVLTLLVHEWRHDSLNTWMTSWLYLYMNDTMTSQIHYAMTLLIHELVLDFRTVHTWLYDFKNSNILTLVYHLKQIKSNRIDYLCDVRNHRKSKDVHSIRFCFNKNSRSWLWLYFPTLAWLALSLVGLFEHPPLLLIGRMRRPGHLSTVPVQNKWVRI